jgi:galactokinase
MNGETLLTKIRGTPGRKLLADLYGPGEAEEACRRYTGLVQGMLHWPENPPGDRPAGFLPDPSLGPAPGTELGEFRVFSAPGRTELGGNHTDHNRGKVLAAAIQLDAAAVAAPRKDHRVIFRSTAYPDVELNLTDAAGNWDPRPRPEERGRTEGLIRGIAAEFAARGTAVRGFTANADSTVLSGSGLSSSAAVEVLLARIFDNFYGGGKRTALELAQIGQRAENDYFGKPSGLMDQAACALGGAAAMDFAESAAPRIQRLNLDLEAAGCALCVVDTRGSHADLTPDYAAIPREMRAVAAFFSQETLGNLDAGTIIARAAELRKAAGDRAILRALHFFRENQRVDAMRAALERAEAAPGEGKARAMAEYLNLVNQSGDSSWELLQNIYAPKNPAEQGIALALALSREFMAAGPSGSGGGAEDDRDGYRGACRVHGGGFAGTIQTYIPPARLGDYRAAMEGIFGAGAVTVLRIRPLGAVELIFPD